MLAPARRWSVAVAHPRAPQLLRVHAVQLYATYAEAAIRGRRCHRRRGVIDPPLGRRLARERYPGRPIVLHRHLRAQDAYERIAPRPGLRVLPQPDYGDVAARRSR